jgi:arylsulfatase A-like enzyme
LGQQTRPSRVYLTAAEVNDSVYEWLDGVQDPFFAWVHYMDVHWPYHVEDRLKHPKDVAQVWRDLAHLHAVNWQGANITPDQRDYYVGLYEQAVQYADAQVGQLLDYLEGSTHAENTMVVMVSDHGEEFLERTHWGHVETNLYDEIVRVPLIMRLPKQVSEKVVHRQVRTLDIMPTILDICDCAVPDGVEGTSLVPLWNGVEDQYNGTVAISERWRNIGDISHIVAVRTNSFKYIWDINQPHQPRLYDLQADPAEKYNVSEQFPEKVQELQAYVDEHLRRAEQTTPDGDVLEPELDEEVVGRLRDLGYIE